MVGIEMKNYCSSLVASLIGILLIASFEDFSLPLGATERPAANQEDSNASQEENESDDADSMPVDLETRIQELESHEGFFDFYWDHKTGKVLLQIEKFGDEFLYVRSLSTGLGSNPVGLDRGQLGDEHVVHFRRVGPKVLLVERNLRFRATSANAAEQRAVEQSFAQSIIWGGTVEAESSSGAVLVDITSWLLSDLHDVRGKLKERDQGDFEFR